MVDAHKKESIRCIRYKSACDHSQIVCKSNDRNLIGMCCVVCVCVRVEGAT